MPNYDCIIPWSGGVESTALVNWALKNNKTPLVIHNRMNAAEWDSVQTMSNIFNIKVFKIQETIDIDLTPDPLNRDFFSKQFDYKPKWSPIIHRWVYWTAYANLLYPTIKHLYYGHCGAGAVRYGDGLGDLMHEGAVAIFKSFENYLSVHGIESKFIAPLDSMTKREQWLSLPEEIKKEIFTCQKQGAVEHKKNCKSYDCNKCHELMRAVPNTELHLIK